MQYVLLSQATLSPPFAQLRVKDKTYHAILHKGTHRRGHLEASSEYAAFPLKRNSYWLWLFTGGTGFFKLGDKRHSFRRGTLIISSPKDPQPVVIKSDHTAAVICIGFSFQAEDKSYLMIPFLEFLSLWAGEQLTASASPALASPKLTRLLQRLMDDYLGMFIVSGIGGMVRFLAAHKTLMDIFFMLTDQLFGKDEPPGVLAGAPLMRVRMEIENSYTRRIRLKDLAAVAFLSPYYLCRAFRKSFGVSPMEYQRQLRMREAKALLTGSTLGVGEIAYAVGFQSIYHFSHTFMRSVGCTPTAYRSRPDIEGYC